MPSTIAEEIQAAADRESDRRCPKCGRGLIPLGMAQVWDDEKNAFGDPAPSFLNCGCDRVTGHYEMDEASERAELARLKAKYEGERPDGR